MKKKIQTGKTENGNRLFGLRGLGSIHALGDILGRDEIFTSAPEKGLYIGGVFR